MSGIPKLLLIYAIAIPLAIVLGFLISAPGMGSIVIIGLLFFLFSLPFLLKHHHLLLIFFWNSAFNVFFLPAQPHFWLLMAILSFGISWLNNIMGQKNFIHVPQLVRPLIFLAIVVLATAFVRGGLGARSLGGASYGGRGYFYMLGSIIGYFALIAERIPVRKAIQRTSLFFLSGTTFGLANVVYVLGPGFYLLFLLVTPDYGQAAADFGVTDIKRIGGLPATCSAVIFFLLARYGLRGVLDLRIPWRFFLFCGALAAASFGGFRSFYMIIALVCLFQFFFEGLHRTFYLPLCVGLSIAALIPIMLFADKLPLSAQRAISFLPVNIDASVAGDAKGSWDWRVNMWKTLVPDIPKYLIVGKGYRIDPEDLYLSDIASQMGLVDPFEVSRVAGDYHSGPLSLIISFGIFGAVGLLWLLYAGGKVLFRNYRYGPNALRSINTFFVAFFTAHGLYFFFFFGDVRSDLFIFTGVLGMSVSLNGGVAKKPARRSIGAAAQMVPQPA